MDCSEGAKIRRHGEIIGSGIGHAAGIKKVFIKVRWQNGDEEHILNMAGIDQVEEPKWWQFWIKNEYITILEGKVKMLKAQLEYIRSKDKG